jgi:hypothetical protein
MYSLPSGYVDARPLRAPRANRVFCTDKKRIRTENTVMDKTNHGLGLLLSKIADCARMCFSSVRSRRSARTGRRPRKFYRRSLMYSLASAYVDARPLRAPRANRAFRTDEKHIRSESTVMKKTRTVWGLYPRSTIGAEGSSSAKHRNSGTTGGATRVARYSS